MLGFTADAVVMALRCVVTTEDSRGGRDCVEERIERCFDAGDRTITVSKLGQILLGRFFCRLILPGMLMIPHGFISLNK